MGKPKGEGGRSKGRPSSSSLAASLLSPGVSNVGFGGYLGSSRVETSSLGEEAGSSSSDVDGELAQHLKRLGRKDPITKVKALTTLGALFKHISGSELALIIPKWAFEYRKLLYDYNRDVRRCTHEAMASLVASVRRGLVPHLKSLMGPWWFSQFDPVPEVAQAARRSLEAAFPAQEKRLDALVLCANEIFLYLEDNLRLKPQEMIEKSLPPDELEEMHNHVISSSLLAVATLLDVLIGTKLQNDGSDMATEGSKGTVKACQSIKSSAERIFSGHNWFLGFFKSKSPRVRSATYSILGTYIKHMPHAFNSNNIKSLSAPILSIFGEKDPSCHSSMWDMVLLFSKKFPDCWSYANVQKSSFPRIWSFLRNGCYGSQQVSYPILILFLDSMPLNSIFGESFLLKFLQCLWAGRNPHASALDLMTFFNAFNECFLWGLFNASRYFSGEEDIFDFQGNLIVNILVVLLWHEYLLPVQNDQEELLIEKSKSVILDEPQILNARFLQGYSVNYPAAYFQELARCIILILSNISLRKSSLLQTFCTSFQKDCLYILQQEEDRQRYSELAGRINIFLLLLDELALQRNEMWPLNHMAGPLFAKLFPLLRPLDSPDAVKILRTLVEIFGPRTIVSQIFNSSGQHRSALSDENVDKLMMNFFLDIFKKDFIPLCMKSYSLSGSSRLDLLISLLDEEIFSEQWSFIMVYAEKQQKDARSDYIRVLAMLMDKIRENIGNKTLGIKLQTISGNSECWQHDFLNSMAISIACQRTPFNRYEASFLCAALGGLSEFDQTCFLSGETVFIVFEEILWKLIGFLHISPFNWARSSIESWDLVNKVEVPPADALEMVQFAFDVINGSIYRLKKLDDEEYELVASILAIIFIIGWEDNVRAVAFVDDELDALLFLTEAKQDNSNDVYLGKKILDFRSRVSSSFLRSLCLRCRAKMEDILVMAIRAAISDADTLSVENITTFCCRWVVEILEDICLDGFEEQEALTKLLSCGESWVIWVSPCSFDGRSSIIPSEIPNRTHEFTYQSFSSFVNKLVLNLGVGKIIAGHVSVPDEQSSSLSLARPWLAAELLCSWKWHGICASESFLPLLNDFAKTESSAEESIISFVAKILIDGAIDHANTGQPIILNAWILSDDEVETTIQNTYLRALIALLLTLTVKNNTWAEEEAYLLLDYTLAKLYLGAEVDLNCLKILPFILNVVIQSLRSGEPVSDRFHRYVSAWLEKALSLPPLALTQATYNDSVEWMQIVISCYPLCILKENKNIQVTAFQDISHLERESLLSLFRRQRYSLGDNSEVRAQTMLANVTAVSIGYCWKEFDDIDWDYVFSQMQLWTNSTVLMMEEATESVDAIIRNARPNSKLDTILRNIEKTMEIIIPSPINITRVALVIFSLVCQHADSTAFQSTRPTTWESIKDDIFEHALRLFFSTGVTEAIAGSFGVETSSIIASSRLICSQFWELVSFCVINSPNHVRILGLQSMELWGLSKGPVEALYAILFSSKSLSSLQLAAFHILSSDPVSRSSVMKESCLIDDNQGENALQSSFDESTCLRDEISCIIRNPANIVLKMDLTSPPRVNIFISWALLLSYLQSLPPSSSLREKLVQCIQDSISPIILDLIFHQFPLKGGSLHGQKKKDVEVPSETTKAANGAKHAITSCSLLFAVDTFWPVSVESTAVIAGSVYGLMIRLLPAYVRNWFTALRDRTLSQSIESFTKVWCSPPLFSEELSQIKGAAFGDDNFSVSVNKSSLEIIATYKKEESGMDLVIRLPGCYPLKPVDVDCTRSLGVSEVKQRKWLLSLTAFVCNQNGAIAEAISTWKSNLEREFEGVEECPICYSIIHTTNHSLPRLACKTCKHKFHSACLYRWFSTSHKSTCPLCQTPF